MTQHLHAVHGGQQHGLGAAAGKQPHGDDARPLVDGLFEGDRIMDLQARDVQDGVAVVGDVAVTLAHGTPQRLKLAADEM